MEMFVSIFDKFFSHDLTETYYVQGSLRYEALDGYGVVLHAQVGSGGNTFRSSYYGYDRSGNNTFTIKAGGAAAEDEKIYPKFKDDLKAFIVDYGRTIRSLDSKDKLTMNIKMPHCHDCELPKSIEVTVELGTLMQYDQQKVSREKAMNQIEIKEVS